MQYFIMIITEYDNNTHRKQVITLWENIFGYEAEHNEPSLVIDKKIAVDTLFFVALSNEQVVATAMAGYDGHRGWIYSVAVHPKHRRAGLGSRLLNHVQDALAALGCIKVNLQILETNKEVQAFYAAHGFLIEDRISMGKRLP